MNIFDGINQKIIDFVNEDNNAPLKNGLGTSGMVFRGSMFGSFTKIEVAQKLNKQNLDVLILGSNPNAPINLDAILGNAPSLYDGFIQQSKQENISEIILKNGKETKWDPINNPPPIWGHYLDLAKMLIPNAEVGMANYFLWGSGTFKKLLQTIHNNDKAMLQRAIAFCNDLNLHILEILKPKLVFVPFSISDLEGVGLTSHLSRHAHQCTHHWVKHRVRFNFFTANFKDHTLVFLPHPSSLQISKEHREKWLSDIVIELKSSI